MKPVKNIAKFKEVVAQRASNLTGTAVLLNAIKPVANGNFGLEFIGRVEISAGGDRPVSLQAKLMASHENWQASSSKPRRAFLTATPEDMATMFPKVDVSKVVDLMDLNIMLDDSYALQITQQLECNISEKNRANYDKYKSWAKYKTGQLKFSKEGRFKIYEKIDVVIGKPQHYLVELAPKTVNVTTAAPEVANLEVGDDY